MSLDLFRQNCLTRLQQMIDTRTTAAVNIRASQFTTTDALALQQVEALSEARAWLECQRVIQEEFTKLMKPQQASSESQTPEKKTEEVY
jgi:hypothetical protein